MLQSVEDYLKDPATTEAEKELIAACREGEPCELGNLPPETSDAPTVRASLIRLLALEKTSLHEAGVWLEGARITGTLDLSFAKCRGRLVLDNCRFEEEPQFAQADLAQLSLDGSHLPKGLFAQGAKVAGSIFLRGVIAKGKVRLSSARIGGQLSCEGASFENAEGKALNAQSVEVTGNVFLSGVTAKGTVDLSGAQIGGQLVLKGATLDGGVGAALIAQSLRIEDGLLFREVKAVSGWLDLTAAHAGGLVDDAASWNKCRQLILDGFTYDRLPGGSESPKTFATRCDWLAKGAEFEGEFYPQPYTQFARVMRAAGHDAEARKALMERERRLYAEAAKTDRAAMKAARDGQAQGDIGWIWLRLHGRRLWASVTRRLVGYGHRPEFAFFWLLGFWLFGILVFSGAYHFGLMVPNSDVIMVSAEWLQAVATNPDAPTAVWMADPTLASKHYETFFASIYALDLFLPIVDLGQQSAWAATTTTTAGWVLRVLTFGYQVMGWLVTSLGLAAVTGFVQRDRPE